MFWHVHNDHNAQLEYGHEKQKVYSDFTQSISSAMTIRLTRDVIQVFLQAFQLLDNCVDTKIWLSRCSNVSSNKMQKTNKHA